MLKGNIFLKWLFLHSIIVDICNEPLGRLRQINFNKFKANQGYVVYSKILSQDTRIRSGKGACYQVTTRVQSPEFTWYKKKPILPSCSLTSTCVPWHMHIHTYEHITNKQST